MTRDEPLQAIETQKAAVANAVRRKAGLDPVVLTMTPLAPNVDPEPIPADKAAAWHQAIIDQKTAEAEIERLRELLDASS